MNLELVQKLRQLIASSSILNPNEKQEWDALLELMNDKQMRELENILSEKLSSSAKAAADKNVESVKPQTAKPLGGISVVSKPVEQQPVKQNATVQMQVKPALPFKIEPVKPKEEEKPQNNFAKPALGHIINLPKFGAPQNLLAKQPNVGVNQAQSNAGKATFLQKLKAILKEPELPAGQKEALLSVGTPDTKTSSELKAVAAVKPVERTGLFVLKTNNLKQTAPPAVPLPPKKEIQTTNVDTPEKPKVLEPAFIKQADREAVAKLLSQKESLKPQIPQQKNPKTQTVEEVLQKQASKTADPKGLEKWPDQYNIKQDPHKVDASQYVQKSQNPALSKASAGAAKTLNVDVHEPKDLEKLETSWLDETSVKKFKDLVKHFGNYEVMRYLEKSPLYKAYLLTGSQILQDASTFEAESKKNPQLLDKESFEKTADLLRVIQAE